MVDNVHFLSQSDMWETPQDLFAKLNKIYHFGTDVCASAENTKCENYYDIEQDGLKQKWTGVCWMNPPYGKPELRCKSNCKKKKCVKRGYHLHKYKPGICDWLEKAYKSSIKGATVVCLVPARTDTAWWHDYVAKGDVELLRGRLTFSNYKSVAPFPSAIVVFGSTLLIGD